MKMIYALAAAMLVALPAAASTLSYEFRLESERFFDVIDPSAEDLGASDGLGPVVTDGRARGLDGPFADVAFGDVIPVTLDIEGKEIVGCSFGTRSCGPIIFSSLAGKGKWEIQTLYDVISFRGNTLTFVEDNAGEAENGLMWMAAEATFTKASNGASKRLTEMPVLPAGVLLLGALPFLLIGRRRR